MQHRTLPILAAFRALAVISCAAACHSGDGNLPATGSGSAARAGSSAGSAAPKAGGSAAPKTDGSAAPVADGSAAPRADGSAAGGSWEDALASCVPGAAFDACTTALAAAKLTMRGEDTTDHREVSFELQPPFGGVTVRTYQKAAGKIVMVNIVALADKGKARKDLLTWLKKQIGTTARRGRSSIAGGAAAGCGADGWGVGWVASKTTHPEVQIQLDSPESTAADDDPGRHKPEDALLRRAGNGIVDICFLLPPDKPGSYIDAPEISATVMKAFLASAHFHGVARPK